MGSIKPQQKMAKVTLQQQWDGLIAQMELIETQHINQFFETFEKPEALFQVGHKGDIEQIKVEGFTVRYLNGERTMYRPYLDNGKRPKKVQIDDLYRYVELMANSDRYILVDYQRSNGLKVAYKWLEILPEKGLAFHVSDLEAESNRRRELFAPREGYSPCAYCRRQVPNESLVKHRIIGRGRKPVWNSWKNKWEDKACITEQDLMFCSGTCAAHEQMSREG